jgi:hypothetical protein
MHRLSVDACGTSTGNETTDLGTLAMMISSTTTLGDRQQVGPTAFVSPPERPPPLCIVGRSTIVASQEPVQTRLPTKFIRTVQLACSLRGYSQK